ncbi:MAG TPA: ferritin-like domain-containing protein [Streptosporangiaceae bacterium]|nr:ferritin-like domain-containing protein [Streptosporangiaceae bacterium]
MGAYLVMTGDLRTQDGGQAGGAGRLAQVIATRGGRAAPEAPFVIEHREALIYMLCEAAELEHGIMCQYLFAAFSLKQSDQEGLSPAELDAVRRWRKQVSHVATQEMLHLALVQNLLSAIGAAPHLTRPNLPAPASHYPAGVQLALLPFGEPALRHFMFLERPEGMDLQDADGLAAVGRAAPVLNERDIVPRGQDFATVGHLYRSIEAGLAHLVELHGEDWLFVGPQRAQATQELFRWPELVAVTDLASAQRAIDEILEQGEGPRGHWQDAHFGQFVRILDEYLQMREANPEFDAVRPVLAANVRQPERDIEVPLITDLLTARVADLFNVCYEILLQIFERFFAHTQETDAQLKTLADATIGLMVQVIKPLGDLITTLPVGQAHPGMTTGPSFELFYESDYLMPHREAAWALLAERLDEAAWLCAELQSGRGRKLAAELSPILAAVEDLSRTLAVHLPAGSTHAGLAEGSAHLEPAELDGLLAHARDMAAAASGPANETARELSEIFAAAYAIVMAAASGRGCSLAEQGQIVPRLVKGVLRPLAAALGHKAARGHKQVAPASDPPVPSGDAAHEGIDSSLWEAAKAITILRVRLGQSGDCPAELVEATAAMQDLACRLGKPSEAAARRGQLWALQAVLPTTVLAQRNGPYLVTNMNRLVNNLGVATKPAPQLALCRCGNSAIKPLCDGSHASSGFTDAKDPKRVPDRRDSYAGQQVTVFDNRGICQHSGFCSDRLANVFRTDAEPFVAASGGRMDEIIRAVRDCPSGALSFGIDDHEARDQVDWGSNREPAIEVTKDGPYRVTGGISLLDADADPQARAEGASTEHYALCRCGQSQNKPFCSGMHWYVGFRDPVPVSGREPTLFEWAGGLPAIRRTTRLLYEKYIPADPLLAPLFAEMPPDQPQRLASWLGASLGGPILSDGASTGLGLPDGTVSEEQRDRLVRLLHRAADDAGLPGDAAFRSAISACAEWAVRATPDEAAAAQRQPMRWDWGPAGPPTTAAEDTGNEDTADVTLPEPGESVSFDAHIKTLFRQQDRQSMSFAFDLWSYDDVRTRAADILTRLQDGSMPCDGAWPAAKVQVFRNWTETGMER